MSRFTKYNRYNAPQESLPHLDKAQELHGFLPNLLGYMAESPSLLGSYLFLSEQVNHTDLTQTERQVVLMTVNRFHECRYCMAGHSQFSEAHGVDMEVIDAIRDDRPLSNPKFVVLRNFTLKLVEARGVVSQALVSDFFNAGYSRRNALEVIALIALKTMSNYTNHLVGTDLDGFAMNQRWVPVNER
ncbi:carboxymuconolactone decarboxylase family protein [Ferrimonas sp.]|uniref:carboxymuconolactone decarboxylase family protein n=1 Tax=Ferrimonas sp. TaxID=2080861 RepID=UPI003A8F98C3